MHTDIVSLLMQVSRCEESANTPSRSLVPKQSLSNISHRRLLRKLQRTHCSHVQLKKRFIKKALLAKLINRYKLSSLTFCYRSELVSYNMSDFFNFMSFFFFKWKIEVFISFHLKKQKPKSRMFSFQCDVFVFF